MNAADGRMYYYSSQVCYYFFFLPFFFFGLGNQHQQLGQVLERNKKNTPEGYGHKVKQSRTPKNRKVQLAPRRLPAALYIRYFFLFKKKKEPHCFICVCKGRRWENGSTCISPTGP